MIYSKERESFSWLNNNSRLFLERGYLLEGIKAEERIRQIADTAEKRLNMPGFADKFYYYMSKGYFSLSSPIWANYGLERGLPISCFGSYIGDSVENIMYTVSEVGMMSKIGGGTSAYFGDIRPRGSGITNNGKSNGSFSFTKLFDTVIDVVSQGNNRRGQFAGYVDIEHRDIEEWLNIHTEGNPIQLMYYGICISKKWWNQMKQGHRKKRRLWAKILQRKVETGIPYIFFTDNVNDNTVNVYKEKNMKIKASNLCIAGDQRVITDKGYLTAKELYEKKLDVKYFDGETIVEGSKMKLREKKADVYKVTLANGLEHKITSYHSLPVIKERRGYKKLLERTIIKTACKNLKIGDVIDIQLKKGIFGKKHNPEKAFISAFTNDTVPSWIWESDEETQWSYVKGLLFDDGTVHRIRLSRTFLDDNDTVHTLNTSRTWKVIYFNTNKEFIKELQLIFNNLGLKCYNKLQKTKRVLSPNGKKITKKYYALTTYSCKSAFEIEKHTGFLSRKGLKLPCDRMFYNPKLGSKIVSIEYASKEDVYCPTISNEKHIFISQGFKTFNCTEIMLPSSEEESFVCCLSSMNLLYYDEWKDTNAVETLFYFLDSVLSEFIEKAKTIFFMKRAYKFAKRHRAIGLGVLGWHSYLQSNMIAFDSFEAMRKNAEIFQNLKTKAYEASKKLADIFGEPKVLKGYGRRNTTCLSVAPTKSSSFILGSVSASVEPLKSNYYIKDLAKIKVVYKNPFLVDLLTVKNKNTTEVWESILLNNGSVQHLQFLEKEEKDVFKTFSEINQMNIIQQAAQRQKLIDQGQSINLMIHPDTPIKDLNNLYVAAEELGLKSLYYQFSINAAQKFNRDLLNCTVCEA